MAISIQEMRGGPARSVIGLAEAIARQGARVSITSCDLGPSFGSPVPVDEALVSVRTCPVRALRFLRVYFPIGWKALLGEVLRTANVMQTSGTFVMPMQASAARMARRLGIPQIVSIRGMLHPEALRVSAWKKFLSRKLYGDRALGLVDCIHATAEAEAGYIRDYGLTQPIAIVPNGVDVESFTAMDRLEARQEVLRAWPVLGDRRIALFLGRLHPIKGLTHLVEAWGRIHRRFPDWHLCVAGPEERSSVADMKARLAASGAAEQTTFLGPVSGRTQKALYSASSLLVHPALSENFGIVIAEALACGRPVLTTRGTPWRELPECRCGWWIETGTEPLEAQLAECLSLDEATLDDMGRRGRELVERKYSWPAVAGQMLAVYRWLALGADRPECVIS